jgi:hypothetical protein
MRLAHTAAMVAIAIFFVVAAYRFDVGTINDAALKTYPQVLPEYAAAKAAASDSHIQVPAPFFFTGARLVDIHSRFGHPAFLLGERRDHGWWYYFPVVFFFKTPLPFLLLSVIGSVVLIARQRTAEAIAIVFAPVAIMAIAMTSSINIGVRHVLAMYPFLSIAASFAVLQGWRSKLPVRIAVIVLVAWQIANSALAHPDYLAWFHELARDPANIALDSNLDWGQDLLRLADWVRRENPKPLHLSYFGSADWRRFVAAEELPRGRCIDGWIAVSEMNLRFGGASNRGDGLEWLRDRTPMRRIGKSIRVYFIEPGSCRP